jgi:membrane protease YdiL (CAAX protease family)
LKYLKLAGWLILYLLVYLLSTLLAWIVLVTHHFLRAFLSGGEFLPIEQFMARNMMPALVISGVLIVAAGFTVVLLRGRNPLHYLEFRALPARHAAAAVLVGCGFAVFLNSFMTLIEIHRFLPDYISEPILQMVTDNFFLTFLAVGIVAPVYEEILLRGLIFKELLHTVKPGMAIAIQALLFGLIHGNMLQFIYAFPMGMFLGYALLKFRSIWAPILVHLAWNSASLIMGAVLPESAGFGLFVLLMLAGGILFAGGILYTAVQGHAPADN